jgi:hypothetical protein
MASPFAQHTPPLKEMNFCTSFLFATRQNFGEDDNFEETPGQDLLNKIKEYETRYGIKAVIGISRLEGLIQLK